MERMAESNVTFQHLLLTRFNLDFSKRTGTAYICDDKWHRDRFELFNRFCLPSVISQTRLNFEWIIFFNEEKKDQYKPFITATEQALDSIQFLFIKPEEDHREILIEYIKENYSQDYLITTRIDNDDCISNHFIETIQEHFFSRYDVFDKQYLVNAGTGYQYEIKFPFRRALIRNYRYSPFLTLFSKMGENEEINIVLKHSHHLWGKHETSEELTDEPSWAQIIHKNNLSNRIRTLKLQVRILDDYFPVLMDDPKNKWWLGAFLMPLQIAMTALRRVAGKFKNVDKDSG